MTIVTLPFIKRYAPPPPAFTFDTPYLKVLLRHCIVGQSCINHWESQPCNVQRRTCWWRDRTGPATPGLDGYCYSELCQAIELSISRLRSELAGYVVMQFIAESRCFLKLHSVSHISRIRLMKMTYCIWNSNGLHL